MIDAHQLTIKRICVHTIEKKVHGSDCAIASCDTDLTFLGSEVEETLKERIKTAFAHRSKSLELDLSIASLASGTFFDLSKELRAVNEKEFIARSCKMAEILAGSQVNSQIPGGYLMIIDALDELGKPVVIAIKAETNDALQRGKSKGATTIQIVKDLFLNKGTKLYKIAALFKKENPDKEYPNSEWSCLLYDEQFTPGEKPTSYFWDNFLKFSISNNGKVQTAYFYSAFTSYIEKSDMPIDEKNKTIEALESLVIDSYTQTIDVEEVKGALIAPERRGEFELKVQKHFPRNFIKDTSAIERKLETQNVYFSHGIKLTGEKKAFNQIVKVIKNSAELDGLEISPSRTILVIEGKPSKIKLEDKPKKVKGDPNRN